MNAIQLPLINELCAPTPAATPPLTGKFQAPTRTPDMVALITLLASPLPLEQLQRIADSDDAAELLARLRGYGLALPCSEVPEADSAGAVVFRMVCALTPADARRITRWLKHRGGRHG